MAKAALVLMAAGIGSRFGGGIKQLEPVGPNGEIIMDYSIHDAIKAGFDKIVFIIRKDIEADFKEIIGSRIEKVCAENNVETAYAFQSTDKVPQGFSAPAARTKPWGTGQAVLMCKGIVNEPFAVINADDYYGKEAFVKLYDFLTGESKGGTDYCMAGFILKNTLSENGGVTRGVCLVDDKGYLTDIVETSDIIKVGDNCESNGKPIDINSAVSMNMWGFTPEFIELLEEGFIKFLKGVDENDLKAEYLIPIYMGELIKSGKVSVKVLPTNDKWFGVTYKEDKPFVVNSFKQLISDGVYDADLYSDL